MGFFGLHASLLPAYRGNAPLVWQIINGESRAGLTLFKFDGGLDTGLIAAQRKVPVGPNRSISEVLTEIHRAALDIIDSHYPALLDGRLRTTPQNEQNVSYCSVRRPEDGCIAWTQPAGYIHNFIRAQSAPYPGAFCFRSGGEKITVWKARLFPHPYFGVPGRVDMVFNGGVAVGCGRGALIMDEIRPAGADGPAAEILSFGETLS
ncbi:MAG: hypothetical protein LUH04_14595 [Clostridium sp.]|nr:hypothetical protein [Clostridium sp.]